MWRSIKMFGRNNKVTNRLLSFSPDEFNSFFASAFQNVDSNSPICADDLPDAQLTVTCDEVCAELKRLKRRSCGPDGVPYWIFRDFAVFLSEAVTLLLNRSLSEGIVPNVLKQALITPIPKNNKPKTQSDYRPISCLPVLSKVFERLFVNKFLLPRLKEHACSSQYAYIPRPGVGTLSALTILNDHILRFLDSPGAVRILSADYSKAFDKINHRIILKALVDLRFPKAVCSWVTAYLSGRVQRVKLGDRLSCWTAITSGVPQGSVVGPLFFVLATDSFSPCCANSKVVRYADDITIVHFLRSTDDDRLQSEWLNLVNWSREHSLPLNWSKCAVMDVVTKKNISLSDIVTDEGNVVPTRTCLSLLGVIFSNDCKWNLHVQNVVKKASRRIFLIRNLKRAGCSKYVMFSAYVAFIRSVMMYCFPVFCNVSSYLFTSMERVERRVFRCMGTDVSNYVSLRDFAKEICERLFKTVENEENHPLRTLFVNRVPTSRNPSTLRPPFARTVRFKNSFISYGA